VNKRIIVAAGKYAVALGLLGYVVAANWSPPGGKGLEYLWQRHAIDGEPFHFEYLAAALAIYTAALVLTLVRWYVLVRAQGLPFRLSDTAAPWPCGTATRPPRCRASCNTSSSCRWAW